jgi:hypothetical protein
MRKRITAQPAEGAGAGPGQWLDVPQLAAVEITSEEPSRPIESALGASGGPGWQAASPGPQTIRLVFDEPQSIRRVYLEFQEADRARTQEFTLGWRAADGTGDQQIVRQQFNFSPGGSTREVEDFRVNLAGVAALELTIIPEIGGGDARASLQRFLLE